jgi:hypothetical protein
VLIDGHLSMEEPAGLPLRDSFIVNLPAAASNEAKVTLRSETIHAHASSDLGKDLPIVDFLW